MPTITEVYRPIQKSFLFALDRDRRDGHKYLMACLQNPELDLTSPRSDAGLLWDVESEHQYLIIRRKSFVDFEPAGGKLTLLTSIETVPGNVQIQEKLVIHGKIARQYSPLIRRDLEVEEFIKSQNLPVPKRPRSRLQPVQPEKLDTWLTEKLERLGLVVHHLDARVIPDIRISKSRRRDSIPAASFSAQISGSPEAIRELLENGFGRAKNFGLGLIQFEQDSQNNS